MLACTRWTKKSQTIVEGEVQRPYEGDARLPMLAGNSLHKACGSAWDLVGCWKSRTQSEVSSLYCTKGSCRGTQFTVFNVLNITSFEFCCIHLPPQPANMNSSSVGVPQAKVMNPQLSQGWWLLQYVSPHDQQNVVKLFQITIVATSYMLFFITSFHPSVETC